MDKVELLQRLKDIEWDDFEVKSATFAIPQNIWETVCAFANTAGGWIVLGVSERGKKFQIDGVSDIAKLEQDFFGVIRSNGKFNEIIKASAYRYTIEDKNVLAFKIESADRKPVYIQSPKNTFIRKGSGDQRATEQEIASMFRDQMFGKKSEESIKGTSLSNLSKKSFSAYRTYLRNFNPELHYNTFDDETFCERIGITKDGMLTYGGLLMFGNEESIVHEFSDFRIDFLEIPAEDYASATPRYSFRLEQQENIWEYYFALITRLRLYVNNPGRLNENGSVVDDVSELSALREALVNMLIHADYFSAMVPRIRVFTNRIEFENPGAYPRPLEELLKQDISIPRNPVLAKLFRCAKLCESAGFGFDKMLSWEKITKAKVDFETTIDSTKATFYRTIKVRKTSPKTSPKTEQIISFIKADKNITVVELSKKINVSDKTIKTLISNLKKQHKIKRIGPNKGGYWEIMD